MLVSTYWPYYSEMECKENYRKALAAYVRKYVTMTILSHTLGRGPLDVEALGFILPSLKGNPTLGVASGAGTAYPSGESDFIIGFNGIPVTRSKVSCVAFCRPLFGKLSNTINVKFDRT